MSKYLALAGWAVLIALGSAIFGYSVAEHDAKDRGDEAQAVARRVAELERIVHETRVAPITTEARAIPLARNDPAC